MIYNIYKSILHKKKNICYKEIKVTVFVLNVCLKGNLIAAAFWNGFSRMLNMNTISGSLHEVK